MIRLLVLFFLILPQMVFAGEYSRDLFKHWSDLNKDGINTRQEVLAEANLGILCPYTGELIKDLTKVDIDHIIPLQYAFYHGAENWTLLRKEQFANDHDNLLAVSSDVNRAKGAKDPSEWLPPNLRYASIYIEKWTTICVKYSLKCDFLALHDLQEKYSKLHNGVKP